MQVIVIDVLETEEATRIYAERSKFTFPVLLDPDGVVMSSYEIRGLPTSFFIDRDGIVRGIWSGQLSPARLKELVDPLL